MSKCSQIEVCNLAEDFEQCRSFVEDLLKKEKVSDTTFDQTMLVFEAIYHNIRNLKGDDESPMILQSEKKWGSTCIRIAYRGEMYKAEELENADLSPEDKVIKAYYDRVDFSFYSGYNKIRITVNHSRGKAMMPCVLGGLMALIVYTALHLLLNHDEEKYVMEEIVFPIEKWCANLVLMVGAPVTFVSFVKNLTDTFIIVDQKSDIKKIRRAIFRSSVLAVLLAFITGWIIMKTFADPQIAYQSPMSVDMSLPELLATLIPSDIFTPFMVFSPFPLLILAVLTTVSLCSVGKYFDRMKRSIDTLYALFSRMLTIIMYGLPLYVFLAFLDILLSDGYGVLTYYLYLILAVAFGFLILGFFYWLRLIRKKIPVRPFVKKMGPLLRENYRIGSAIDAAPFNIRYCARTWSMNRKKLEINIPVLAEINLDGNCFVITLLPLILMFASNTEVTFTNMILICILAFFLSLGAPNQPGSVLISILIVLNFMMADDLVSNAFIFEVLFGGLLNLVNVTGDIVTVYEMERE